MTWRQWFVCIACYFLNLHRWKPIVRADWVLSQEGLRISSRMGWIVGKKCRRCGCTTNIERPHLYLSDGQ